MEPIIPPPDIFCCTCGKPGKHYTDECPDRFCRYCGRDHREQEESLAECEQFPPKGYYHCRTQHSPHERIVAELWEDTMNREPDTVTQLIGQYATIEQEKMAYTMIQWLGTNVGSAYMKRLQRAMEDLPGCERCGGKRMPEAKYCSLCKYHIDASLIKV
jgi:predicted amidophosphoribosyltransferase